MRPTLMLMAGASLFCLGLLVQPLHAAKYDPGASDTEIKIGHTGPYSGPASEYGTIGKAIAAYIAKINDDGGVNGRKLNFITLDDGYSPPKTVEQTRRLVEQDQVLLVFQPLGTAPNTAVQKYLNLQKVPQLFVASGATKWGDPQHFPWTMGWTPNYQTEGKIYARYILEHIPNAKIGILFQNDDYGKDYVTGLKLGLGSHQDLIVSEQSYEVTSPTVDSQIATLKNSGANVFFNVSTPKFAAQSIRKLADIGWKPAHFLNNVASTIGGVMQPAGFENDQGIISVEYLKDADDPAWTNDPAMQTWHAWMAKYLPDGNLHDRYNVYGYTVTMALVQVLKQCGDELTRENVMRQAANLHNLALPMLLPGIKVNTSPTDYFPIQQEQLQRFEGKRWVRFGPIIAGD
jgi:branched-chain amino acid transport system substrate-binding protein